jgi:hypothetical protein
VKLVAGEVDSRQLGVADFDAFVVLAVIDAGVDLRSR